MTPEETRGLVDEVRSWPQEERARRCRQLVEGPSLFDIEVASACNIVCSFCPRTSMTRDRALMDQATFDAVERFLPSDATVMFSGLGDALLQPRLAEWTGRLTARGISCCVITNGVRLVPEKQEELVAAGMAQFQVSVHGLDLETVRSVVPRGARPQRVKENLEHLSRRQPSSLRVRLNFVETDQNAHARAEVEAWAAELGFEFFHRHEHTRGGSLGLGRHGARTEGCGIYSSVTFIDADGRVLPCVNDVTGDGTAGSVFELDWTSVRDWKRRTIQEGSWFSACTQCDDDYRWRILGSMEL
mgnify:CR=1 FL=1